MIMDTEEIKYPRRNLIPEEIAWLVVVNKEGVQRALIDAGFNNDNNNNSDSDGRIVRIIYDNQLNIKLNDSVLLLLSTTPYLRNCIHCHEAIRGVMEKLREFVSSLVR